MVLSADWRRKKEIEDTNRRLCEGDRDTSLHRKKWRPFYLCAASRLASSKFAAKTYGILRRVVYSFVKSHVPSAHLRDLDNNK